MAISSASDRSALNPINGSEWETYENGRATSAVSRVTLKRHRLSQSIVAGGIAIGDILVVYTAGVIPYLLYVYPRKAAFFIAYQAVMLIFGVILVQTLAMGGFYRFEHIVRPLRRLLGMSLRIATAFGLLLAFAFALKVSDDYSRVWAFAWFAGTLVLISAYRSIVALVLRHLATKGFIGRNILVFGAGAHGASLIERLQRNGEDRKSTRLNSSH